MTYSGTELTCELCEYKQNLAKRTKLKSTIYKSVMDKKINMSVVYDQSLHRTSKIDCINAECPTHDIEKWGQHTDDGFLIQPDMVMMNYYDKEDRINTYVCCVCKHTTLPQQNL